MAKGLPESVEGLRCIADWAAELKPAGIPKDVRRRAVMVLVDDVTAMIAARDEPEVVSIYEYSRRRAKLAEATLLDGGMSRVDRERAAFANAVAANWCELDEGYRVVGCHGGLYSVPAAIAEAESAGLAVEDLDRKSVV